MNFPLTDTEIDAVARHNAGKAFHYSAKFDNTAISSAQDYPFLPSCFRFLYLKDNSDLG